MGGDHLVEALGVDLVIEAAGRVRPRAIGANGEHALLALVAFVFFEYQGFKANGVGGYLSKFFPFGEFRKGVGAGIILNGQLFQGDGYGAGEFGHVSTGTAAVPCRCGRQGCLETMTSMRALVDAAGVRVVSCLLTARGPRLTASGPVPYDAYDAPRHSVAGVGAHGRWPDPVTGSESAIGG